jgi:uncharacterized protein YbgA (DUF1722 family)/uncharacterized protein YbbK (DUF523 family)
MGDVDDRPRIGISSCLLGEQVRFDAGHKRDPFLVETFGRHVEWVPVCPELEAGFGVPRDPMRLVARVPGDRTRDEPYRADQIRLIVIKSGDDVTARLQRYSAKKVERLAGAGLSGYVLKKDSPSCGMQRVKVYEGAMAERAGRGLFADALLTRLPDLPVEEEGRLCDPRLRENFVERVFAYRRLRQLFESRWTVGALVSFHTAHKLTLMAHSPVAYRELGRLVANASGTARAALASGYQSQFMGALTRLATPKRHANVLQHMFGYFSAQLDAAGRQEMLALIEDHRAGLVPLVVPMTLMRHYVRQFGVDYLRGQTYLDPHPRELSLRNHV